MYLHDSHKSTKNHRLTFRNLTQILPFQTIPFYKIRHLPARSRNNLLNPQKHYKKGQDLEERRIHSGRTNFQKLVQPKNRTFH